MTIITPELRQAIEQAGNEPARLVDPVTNRTYLLVREDDFVCLPVDWSGDVSSDEATQLMWDTMKGDWDDPAMDVYDSEKYS